MNEKQEFTLVRCEVEARNKLAALAKVEDRSMANMLGQLILRAWKEAVQAGQVHPAAEELARPAGDAQAVE